MCILKIFSETDSFKAFAECSPIPVYSVHDATDIKDTRKNKTHGVFRISFDVSDCEWDDLPGQVEDAIAFLSLHAISIRKLVDSHNVSDAFLDFPIWSRLDENIVNQNDRLPRQLISLCARAGIGVEMALYSRDNTKSSAETR
jgi:hypothetical protein